MVCDPAYRDLKSILTKKFRFGVPNPRQLHVQGVFSGNLSLDVAKRSSGILVGVVCVEFVPRR
ncbi:hypothetical protein NC651_001731 [Populus alba x Populus x berolinensis]|nr:hypothetical protein NC651_001731 [Populus alba x Populus x berolinensis]